MMEKLRGGKTCANTVGMATKRTITVWVIEIVCYYCQVEDKNILITDALCED